MENAHEYRRTNTDCATCMELKDVEDTQDRQLGEGDDNFFHVPQLIVNPDDGQTDTEASGGRRSKKRSKTKRLRKRLCTTKRRYNKRSKKQV